MDNPNLYDMLYSVSTHDAHRIMAGSSLQLLGSRGSINGSGVTSSNLVPRVQIRSRFKMSMRVCGPKLSLCGCLVSAWGILQLVIMGICFQYRSISFVEDLSLANETYSDANDLFMEMEKAFDMGANNCYIAALLYFVTLLVSLHQYWLNSRVTAAGYERYS